MYCLSFFFYAEDVYTNDSSEESIDQLEKMKEDIKIDHIKRILQIKDSNFFNYHQEESLVSLQKVYQV